jgi:hypothetical protein
MTSLLHLWSCHINHNISATRTQPYLTDRHMLGHINRVWAAWVTSNRFLQVHTIQLALRFSIYHSPGTKKTYVECTKYVRRHTPATASSRQPHTTNKRTMAKASRFCYHDISFISWPNLMFETRKSIRSICCGHPSNLFSIGGLQLQFSVEVCLLLADLASRIF